ncbi:MAG: hypothetical protein WAL75_11955 [Terracidiphilus sp.]
MIDAPNKTTEGYAVVDEASAAAEPYPYIYINSDGSARELHEDERKYLQTRFLPMDGARPYIKDGYSQKNGWGEISGFMHRSKLPPDVLAAASPAENPNKPLTREQQFDLLRSKGFEVEENSDGSFTARRAKATDSE